MKLSLVIPLYNEEENVPLIGKKVAACLDKLDFSDVEVLFVNDGSYDATQRALESLAQQDPRFKVIEFMRNFGQTSALMAGIDHAQGEIIITMDGDLENDPEDIPRLLQELEAGYDVCSGWRKNRWQGSLSQKILRSIPSRFANTLISRISGVSLHDYGCTLKAYRAPYIKGVRLYGEMHRFIPIYAVMQGAKVTEIPVHFHPRLHGVSKYGIGRSFKVVLDLLFVKFFLKFSQTPIYLFGGFGLVNMFFSFLTFAWMLFLKLGQGVSFIKTPLPILSVALFLVGMFSLFMGILAEMLMRTYYESQGKKSYVVKSVL